MNGKRNMWIGAAVGVAIAAASLLALIKLLPEISWQDILAAYEAVSGWRIALAIGVIALCYAALSLYDHIALETIGKKLPWRVTIAGSISAYALSHNLGLAPLTASGARWRVYAPHGLNIPDIARIVVITGMSFWLGIIVLVGMGLIIAPASISSNLPVVNAETGAQLLGIAILAFDLGYLIAIGRGAKNLGWKRVSLPLPGLRHAILQNGLGAIEIALASLALLLLTPGLTLQDYPVVFLAYLVAFISVLITHAPGGVGVLELVIIAMMPTYDKTELLTGLLLFRMFFHVCPLIVAIGILTLAGRSKASKPHAYQEEKTVTP